MAKVRVYLDYKPLRVLPYGNANPDEEAKKSHLEGSYRTIDDENIPASKEYRKYWIFDGEKVLVDEVAKNKDLAEKEAETLAEKEITDSIKDKLVKNAGFTEAEAEKMLNL